MEKLRENNSIFQQLFLYKRYIEKYGTDFLNSAKPV